MKTIGKSFNALFAVLAVTLSATVPNAFGVNPTPDGCYPLYTTAEGCDALSLLTTGAGNTGLGWNALLSDTTGSYNTGVGAGALIFNNADSNTAVGAAALLLNNTGTENTAVGTDAMLYNDTGMQNTAIGAFALFANTAGAFNTAHGDQALLSNTTGNFNTANGVQALANNTTGLSNTALGVAALFFNNTGEHNTAIGVDALEFNTIGNDNIALGRFAGRNLTTGDNNIDIGNVGVADEANTIRIGDPAVQTATFVAGINGATASGGVAVYINSDGQLGTLTSSARFKTDIKPMGSASEAILALKPVTFRYNHDIDPKSIPQFGLVAEDLEKIDPDLVAHGPDGKPYTVRYEAVNAMLLNEFLKEHRKVQEQEAAIGELKATLAQQQRDFQSTATHQQKQIQALTSGLQKVSVELEMRRPAHPTVKNRWKRQVFASVGTERLDD